MKNKFVISIFLALLVVFTAAMPSFASVKQVAVKFLYAMGGVVLSSVIIFAGLTLYNRFFVSPKYTKNDDATLKTPDNTEDAISFFIKKNKLR